MFDLLQGDSSKLFTKVVWWKLPDIGWTKCNTDGASKGNPGTSSYGFCLRDDLGDLIYA